MIILFFSREKGDVVVWGFGKYLVGVMERKGLSKWGVMKSKEESGG